MYLGTLRCRLERALHDCRRLRGLAGEADVQPAGDQDLGIVEEVTRRLLLVAPALAAGLRGSELAPMDRRRRNAASHCFAVPAADIAGAGSTALNRIQRGSVGSKGQLERKPDVDEAADMSEKLVSVSAHSHHLPQSVVQKAGAPGATESTKEFAAVSASLNIFTGRMQQKADSVQVRNLKRALEPKAVVEGAPEPLDEVTHHGHHLAEVVQTKSDLGAACILDHAVEVKGNADDERSLRKAMAGMASSEEMEQLMTTLDGKADDYELRSAQGPLSSKADVDGLCAVDNMHSGKGSGETGWLRHAPGCDAECDELNVFKAAPCDNIFLGGCAGPSVGSTDGGSRVRVAGANDTLCRRRVRRRVGLVVRCARPHEPHDHRAEGRYVAAGGAHVRAVAAGSAQGRAVAAGLAEGRDVAAPPAEEAAPLAATERLSTAAAAVHAFDDFHLDSARLGRAAPPQAQAPRCSLRRVAEAQIEKPTRPSCSSGALVAVWPPPSTQEGRAIAAAVQHPTAAIGAVPTAAPAALSTDGLSTLERQQLRRQVRGELGHRLTPPLAAAAAAPPGPAPEEVAPRVLPAPVAQSVAQASPCPVAALAAVTAALDVRLEANARKMRLPGGVPDVISLKGLRRDVEARLGCPEGGLLSLAEVKAFVSAYFQAKDASRR